MEPDWSEKNQEPPNENYQPYPPRSLFKIFVPFLVLAVLSCLWALYASHLQALMTSSFLRDIPLILGALIAYIHNFRHAVPFRQSIKVIAFFLIFLIGFSIIVLGEGSICVVIMIPILLIQMIIGAALMKWLCNKIWKPNKVIYSLALLPFFLLSLPENPQLYYGELEKSIIIDAPANVIWQQINHADHIQKKELKPSLIYSIGVPSPISGITQNTKEGLIRYSVWGKNIHFEEIIQQSKPNQYLSWTYRFTPDSVPAGALDDHVTIGGKYFDLKYTSFKLTPINKQQTKLTLTIDYRLSTEVNVYANAVTQLMIGDFSNVILDFYKNRSERAQS